MAQINFEANIKNFDKEEMKKLQVCVSYGNQEKEII